jgi:hypothetical protein
MTDPHKADQATIAFRRLLKDAATGDQARVDALVVLAQRTMFAVTWPGGESEIRTLTNSAGETALPLFTSREMLEEAARRYGWQSPDGSLPSVEMGARQALRQAMARSVHFVVVDIGADYSVEFTLEEIQPLVSAQSERDSVGPFAGAGRVSSTLLQAVKRSRSEFPPSMPAQAAAGAQPVTLEGIPTPPPPAATATVPRIGGEPPRAPAPAPATAREEPLDLRAPKTVTSAETPSARATEPAFRAVRPEEVEPEEPGQILLRPLLQPLSEQLVDAVSEKLRQYPEVEWACTVGGKLGEEFFPVIGLRVDPSFASRVEEIAAAVGEQCERHGSSVQVVSLTAARQLGSAREFGTVFFPWRKKPRATR